MAHFAMAYHQCGPEQRIKLHLTAWLGVDGVNWSGHGKSKMAGLTYIPGRGFSPTCIVLYIG